MGNNGKAFDSFLSHDFFIYPQIGTLTDKEQLVLSLERQYQEDVGVLAALFFNYVKLSPGEALYMQMNRMRISLGNALNVWPLQTMLAVFSFQIWSAKIY
jgi:hypothetical protein